MTLPFWMRALAASIILAAIAGFVAVIYHGIYLRGYHARDIEAKASEANINRQHQAALAAAEKARRDKEQHLTGIINELANQYQEVKSNAEAVQDKLRADVRTHAVRLSIPASAKCTDSADAGGPDTALAHGTGDQTRAELMPETAIALIDIATDGDRAMRERNWLIDAYNAVRDACAVQPVNSAP
jgi:hypothetical protein